jgi:hypothetical protein
MAVPGFYVPEPQILSTISDTTPRVYVPSSEYTQSLIEWFDERIKFGSAQ